MPEPRFFTISDIIARTGAVERQVLMWADAGALMATPQTSRAGRGVHRQFVWREVEIAAVLAAVAPFRLPIGVMVEIGGIVRIGLALGDAPPELVLGAALGWAFQAARRGEPDIELVLLPSGEDGHFSYFLNWPARPDATTAPQPKKPTKACLIANLSECWKGLR